MLSFQVNKDVYIYIMQGFWKGSIIGCVKRFHIEPQNGSK